ncbi:asparagine synthase-related protein [Flavobacteriaceae bacterium]|nr:asparagine synthase-related protein [Flavobacteriaceae bacterium]
MDIIIRNKPNTKTPDFPFEFEYTLQENETFFETQELIFFLKSNYSDSTIDKCLKRPDLLTLEIIQKSFCGDGVWVVFDKKKKQVVLGRDESGLNSIYYYHDEFEVRVSTISHKIAKEKKLKLSRDSVYQFLYFDYLFDGQSFYNRVKELEIGEVLCLNKNFKLKPLKPNRINLPYKENKLTEEENINSLRQKIVNAHKKYINKKNIVFLSGGIDSVAMLIAITDLAEIQNIESLSFKVMGTKQDETLYAKSISKKLKVKLDVVTKKLSSKIDYNLFVERIQKTNNPYPGIWIFNELGINKSKTFFAGQDTRLHTPSLNFIDKIAFEIFNLKFIGKNIIFWLLNITLFPLQYVCGIVYLMGVKSKLFEGLRRALYVFDIEKYIRIAYFKVDTFKLKSLGLPLINLGEIVEKYKMDMTKVFDKRSLYNEIVSLKWREQYVSDIKYMSELVTSFGGKMAMPFYEKELVEFSSTIPFKLSTKTIIGKSQFGSKKVKVSKYVLRQALIDKIDKKTYGRSKAVSQTFHLLFNMGLGKVIKKIIVEDQLNSNSLINEFKLQKFIHPFIRKNKPWTIKDEKMLLKMHNLSCLIIYKKMAEGKI